MIRTVLLVTFAFLLFSLMLPVRSVAFSLWDWKGDRLSYAWGNALFHLGHLGLYTNGASMYFFTEASIHCPHCANLNTNFYTTIWACGSRGYAKVSLQPDSNQFLTLEYNRNPPYA